MTKVSQLTLIFRDKLQTLHQNSKKNSDDDVKKNPLDLSSDNNDNQLTSWFDSSSSFQMPLHYPNFKKEEYEIMSEEELDRLLKLYGLPTDLGDLSYKKQFAVGAFVWEKEINSCSGKHESENPNSSIGDLEKSSMMGLMAVFKYAIHYICSMSIQKNPS